MSEGAPSGPEVVVGAPIIRRRFTKNTAAQMVPPSLRLLLGLALMGALSRHLGVRGLGEYGVVLAVVTTVQGVVNDVGLVTICVRDVARRPEDRAWLIPSAAVLQLILSAASYLVVVVVVLVARYPAEVGAALLIYGLVLPLTAVDLLAVPLQAELRLTRLMAPTLSGPVLTFVFVMGVILEGGPLVAVVAASVAATAVQYAWTAILCRPSLGPGLRVTARPWGYLLRESLPVGLNTVVSVLTQQAPLLVLSRLDLTAAGIFAAASRIPQQMVVVPLSVRGSAFPLLSDAWAHDRRRFASLARSLVSLIAVFAVLATVLAIGWRLPAVTLAFGLRFTGAAVPFALLACSYGLVSVGILFADMLTVAGHQRLNLAVSLATAPVLAILLALLAPGGGATGAALAVTGYYLVLVAAGIAAAAWRLGKPVPVGFLAPTLVAFGAGWLGGYVTAAVGLPGGDAASATAGIMAAAAVVLWWHREAAVTIWTRRSQWRDVLMAEIRGMEI